MQELAEYTSEAVKWMSESWPSAMAKGFDHAMKNPVSRETLLFAVTEAYRKEEMLKRIKRHGENAEFLSIDDFTNSKWMSEHTLKQTAEDQYVLKEAHKFPVLPNNPYTGQEEAFLGQLKDLADKMGIELRKVEWQVAEDALRPANLEQPSPPTAQ